MISIKYKALFDLELKHSYYQSGLCHDLVIAPTAECRTLLNYCGLRFLKTQAGGKLFAKVNTVDGKDIIKSPLPEATKFTFILKSTNNSFENFTQLTLARSKNQHYYFNNLTNNLAADSSPSLLTNTTSKIVSDTDLSVFKSNTFSFTETNNAATLLSELKFIDSGEVVGQELNNHNDTFNFSYDLKKTPSGRVKFFISNTERASMYVANGYDYADMFGVIEIFYKSNLPAAYLFQLADNSVETKFYKINFANRSTRWRYIITNKYNQSVTGVTVAKTNGTAIAFAPQAGAPAGQFIAASGIPVPLKEEPVAGIKLTDQADKVLIANLPNPSLNLVKQEGTNIFSDILITI